MGVPIRVQGIESRSDDPADLDGVLEQCRIIAAYVDAGNEVLPNTAVRRLAELMKQRVW